MKRILTSLAVAAAATSATQAQVYINEALVNPPGSDSSATAGFEYFELRGAANQSLAGYYLISLEGQGTTGRGDINQFFNLSTFALGANGYLFARQFGSPYTSVNPNATLIENTVGQGWGAPGTSTVGHSADGTPAQLDLENSATTLLLVNIGLGAAPTLTDDLDADNNGVLELPAGWTIADSVGVMDGVSGAAGDYSYGAVTLRAGGLGSASQGNIIEVSPSAGTSFYVARKGESTGSTADDWFGAFLTGSAGNFTIGTSSDPSYTGQALSVMNYGGPNAVPEPGTLALAGCGLLTLWALRRRK